MPIIGLDLGSNNFRAVELESNKGNFILKNFAEYQSPNLNLASDTQASLDEYARSLKEFIQEHKFTTDEVVLGLREANVFTRVISYPKMSLKEVKSSLSFEAEQYIPIPLDEVSYDFQIMEDDMAPEGKMNVLLVAAKKSMLEKYVQLIKKANLSIKGIEPETLALQRSLQVASNTSSASIIVNIGAETTQVIVSYKGYVRFTRSINVGGTLLTKTLAQGLKLDLIQAEEYKKTYGLDNSQVEGKIYNILAPVVANILAEINKSQNYYTTHNPGVNINKVILSGGTALMPGILFYIASNISLEVELANPWKNILLSSKIEKDKDYLIQQGPVFVTSLGLALKELE